VRSPYYHKSAATGDGVQDLAVASELSNNVSVLINNTPP